MDKNMILQKLARESNEKGGFNGACEDIKDYQLQAIKTSDDLVSVKNTVQTTVRSITTVSTELAKTAEVLQGTNATMTDVVEVLNTNLEVTNGILNELETLNKKLVRMNKRLALEV